MSKWNHARGKVLAATTALTMSAGLITPSMLPVLAEEAKEASVDLYPYPQEMTYDADTREGMDVPEEVVIVVKGDKDEIWSAKLEEILTEKGIAFTYADQAADGKTSLVISTSEADLPSEGAASKTVLDESQGYILFTDNDKKAAGEITLVGSDRDGVWNGILSLEQILAQANEDGKMAEVLVADYPDIKMRGFVEGFYGLPWSHQNRMALIEDSSEYKINTYVYAPKDDPYHKDQWRTLYPETEAAQLKELVDQCEKNNVEFIWCAHPGNGYNYSTDDDYNKLIAKIEQLYSLGVRRFGLSYDDLGGSSNGANQAALINRVQNYLDETHGDCGTMFTVGQRYTDGWGADWETYLRPFLSGLDDSVIVMWTGKNTGGNCDADSFEGPKNRVGYEQPLAFWFNYPVNDMAFGRLIMGDLDMDPELAGLRGFLMNPMNQAQASKVAIYQGADYSWNIHDYNKDRSWRRSVTEVSPEHTDALLRFCENTTYHAFEDIHHDESTWMQPYFDALNTAIASGNDLDKAVADLKAKFAEMVSDADELLAMDDELLLADLQKHLEAYKDLGEAGVHAMEGFEKAMAIDNTGMADSISKMRESITSANSRRISQMDRNGYVSTIQTELCTARIRPFLNEAPDKMEIVFKNALAAPAENRVISSAEASGTAALVSGNYEGTIEAVLPKYGYAGMALEKAVKVSSLTMTPAVEGTRIEYSLNGVDWQTYTGEEGNIDMAYARLVNESDADAAVNGVLKAEVVYPAPSEATASTNMSRWESNYISNIVDGNLNTKYYSADASAAGDYFMVDLKTPVPLHDVAVYYAANPKGLDQGYDAFSKTKLEVSTDNVTWKQIGDIIATSDAESITNGSTIMAKVSWNGEGELARYMRFSAAEAYKNWVQVFEVEYNKNAPEGGDAEVLLAETNTNGAFRNVYDGDINTSFDLTAPADGDYLIYNLSSITSVKDLMILQGDACNAKISVQDFDGEWREVGTLTAPSETISVNALIKAVRLDFEAGTPASIKEIVVKATDPLMPGTITMPEGYEEVKVDKTLLEMAVAEGDSLNNEESLEGVNELVKENFIAMLDAAKAVLADESASQEAVDEAWDNLSNAIHMLSFKTDKSALAALIAECDEIDLDLYEDGEAKEAFASALEKAKEVNDDPAVLTEQSINEAIEALMNAKGALVKKPVVVIDTARLEKLLAKTEGLNLDLYVSAGKPELDAAQVKARELIAAPTTQEEVDAHVGVLNEAYLNLRLKADEELLKKLQDFLNKVETANLDLLTEDEQAVVQEAVMMARTVLAKNEPESVEAQEAIKKVNEALPLLEKTDPSKPIDPEKPDNPQKPDNPIDPGKPSDPQKPANPANPEKPADPGTQNSTGLKPSAPQNSAGNSAKTGVGSMGFAAAGLAALGSMLALKRRRNK